MAAIEGWNLARVPARDNHERAHTAWTAIEAAHRMNLRSGEERILLSLSTVTIHGALYADVVLGDPKAPSDSSRTIRSRLGPEAIEGDPRPGDRVRVEGFLGTVLRIVRLTGRSQPGI